mmetsp:Transcript_5206/g.9318  ORF Transcript_5206/g.9318 Transcript_5206/m.9318 type:complete len:101 (+) Transcript_5206:3-305(+)
MEAGMSAPPATLHAPWVAHGAVDTVAADVPGAVPLLVCRGWPDPGSTLLAGEPPALVEAAVEADVVDGGCEEFPMQKDGTESELPIFAGLAGRIDAEGES